MPHLPHVRRHKAGRNLRPKTTPNPCCRDKSGASATTEEEISRRVDANQGYPGDGKAAAASCIGPVCRLHSCGAASGAMIGSLSFVPAMPCRDPLPCRAASLLSMPKAARNAARAAHRVRRTVPAALAGTDLSQASGLGRQGLGTCASCLWLAAAVSQLPDQSAGPTGEQ